MLRALGAQVIEADELGRALMEPGQSVYAAIVQAFGPGVVLGDGRLNRPRLAQLAFNQGRLDELNAIVHPAVIAAQQRWMADVFAHDPQAVAVVESALIFEVERDAHARGEHDGALSDWRRRFNRVIVLTAPDDLKVARYVARVATAPESRDAAERDARMRLARQMPDKEKAARADFVLENTGDLDDLKKRVNAIWQHLVAESRGASSDGRRAKDR
jgi:dephospho-CoA kinase